MRIIFHKRATKYRSLLLKMTYKEKGSYECTLQCTNASDRVTKQIHSKEPISHSTEPCIHSKRAPHTLKKSIKYTQKKNHIHSNRTPHTLPCIHLKSDEPYTLKKSTKYTEKSPYHTQQSLVYTRKELPYIDSKRDTPYRLKKSIEYTEKSHLLFVEGKARCEG